MPQSLPYSLECECKIVMPKAIPIANNNRSKEQKTSGLNGITELGTHVWLKNKRFRLNIFNLVEKDQKKLFYYTR